MKKQKLSIDKFRIVRLTNPSSIFGGTGTITDDPTTTDDPNPTRTNKTFPPPPPSIDPNDPFGECGD